MGQGVEYRVVPRMKPAPLNASSSSSLSVRKWGGANESPALVRPTVLSEPTTASERAIFKAGFIWGPPIPHPARGVKRQIQATFRKSVLTAGPPHRPSGVCGLLTGDTRGIPWTFFWRLCKVHDIPSLYFPVYSEHE